MAFWKKSGTIMVLLMFLSSCSWFGNRFGKDDADCPAGACDEPNALDEKSANDSWYCYGVQEDRSWDCGHEYQPEKVASIDPSAARQATPPIEPPVIEEIDHIEEPLPVESRIPETVTETKTAPAPANLTISAAGSEQGGNFILGLSAEAYAVQLIAMQDESSVLDYASHNGIGAPLYARIQSKESDWYVLLLGTYSDRQSATEAKDSWESTRTLKVRPWVRKLGPLQDAIRLARN